MMIENNDGHAKDENFSCVSMDFIIIDKIETWYIILTL